jgi:tRNA threonylcarbamoyladenosine biosynthesis protein TsaE
VTSPPRNPDCGFFRVISRSEDETRTLGTVIGESLTEGGVIALVGDLGAGKTRLVRAICAGLSVDLSDVTSPTFVLIHEYDGRLPVYHFDTYRLRDVSEFLDLGADELMDGECVCLIEWADRVVHVLPEDRLTITISIESATARAFVMQSTGPAATELVQRTRTRLLESGLAPASEPIP